MGSASKRFKRVLGSIILLCAIGAVGVAYFLYQQQKVAAVSNFEDCKQGGYPVMESYPARCTVGGKTFIEEIPSPSGTSGSDGALAFRDIPVDPAVQIGAETAGYYLYRDEAAWKGFWDTMNTAVGVTEPEIDFSKEMVLVVFAGAQPSGGHEIVVQRVEDRTDKLAVQVQQLHPGPKCITASAITHPYDVVALPQSEKPVELITTNVERSCEE